MSSLLFLLVPYSGAVFANFGCNGFNAPFRIGRGTVVAVSMGRGGGAGCHTDLSDTSSERQRAGYSGWWLNQPIWKILVKLSDHSPNRGENTQYLQPPISPLVLWFALVISIVSGLHSLAIKKCTNPAKFIENDYD